MKRSRKSHTKSRGGCVTCKIRRKKCDEVRPYCGTCSRSGRACGGYKVFDQYIQRTDEAAGGQALLVTRYDSSSDQAVTNQNTSFGQIKLRETPRVWLLEPDQEALYFGFFIRNTAPQFSSYYDSTFWKSVVLPQCINYPVVKQAALALGAIHRFHSFQTAPSIPGNMEYALRAYVQAIRLLNQTLENSPKLEVGLLVSMLFAAFELFQDNHETAATHLSHGLRAAFSAKTRGVLLRPTNRSSVFTEKNLRELINTVHQMLYGSFGRQPSSDRDALALEFKCLGEAYASISTQWHVLSCVMTEQRGHIDYSYYSEQLSQWREVFVKHLATTEETMSKLERQQQRLLKIFHDSISLLVLARANRCDEVEERSSMSRMLRHENLNAHFSKLSMLVESLVHNPDSLTHFSNGQLRHFSIDSGLLPSSECSLMNMSLNSSKVYQVAEKLTALESQIAITNNLVPVDAMWVDLATALEDGLVTLRYCTSQSSDNLIWTQKTIKL